MVRARFVRLLLRNFLALGRHLRVNALTNVHRTDIIGLLLLPLKKPVREVWERFQPQPPSVATQLTLAATAQLRNTTIAFLIYLETPTDKYKHLFVDTRDKENLDS